MTVNRQKNIGDFIVDFYIASARIVIEFEKLHIKVLRYRNIDLNRNFDAVDEEIAVCTARATRHITKQT